MQPLSASPLGAAGFPAAADFHHLSLGLGSWSAALARLEDAAQAQSILAWSETPAGQRLLAALFGNSAFLGMAATKEPAFLSRLVLEGPEPPLAELLAPIEADLDPGEAIAALMRRLRVAKRRVALLVAVMDLSGMWPLERQTGALSRFAEAAIGAALRHLLRQAQQRSRLTPVDVTAPERDCGLFVLGMGKLGGRELNYSSDIDLILLYETQRYETEASRLAMRDGPQPVFVRLARDLVRILDERTSDGYVFRTDLRLRPDPASTPPALSVAAALGYYESVGQNWERAAMVKARPVAGDRAAADRFLRELRPFIWRRHLDFAAIQDIHSIKRQINAHRGGGRIAIEGHDVKIGRGGIREIEFFAQTQQLIWGGRLPELRVAPTCEALRCLAATGRIAIEAAETLIEDYRFLRRVEHRLQMADDRQTHRLPADAAGIAWLATFMGYADAESFSAALRARLVSVERHYAALFEEAPSLSGPGNLVFTGTEDDPETLDTLTRLGFTDPSVVAALIRGWHHGRMPATRSQRAREILTELVPGLLRLFGATAHPDTAIRHFDQFLAGLPAGVQLFSLFLANPGLLELVAEIMAGAPGLATQLARRPALLDSVLSAGFFGPLGDRAGLAAELAAVLEGVRDFADSLDLVRRWANERRFQVGVQLLRRALDGAAAGPILADIAQAALAALLPAVRAEIARQHGDVPGGRFAVIGMGKLGSREMSPASDLDLVMIYDVPEAVLPSDGPKPLAASTYYARLSQRLIGAVTAPTAEGSLYEVDMRLRPSGAAGPIASSLEAFSLYQWESAWTWEHMALTRARPVAGDRSLCIEIERIAAEILKRERDPDALVRDIADMRGRIAEQHPKPAFWDMKHRPGGMLDIEFVAQYLSLREASRHPEILRRDVPSTLAACEAAGILDPRAAQALIPAMALYQQVSAILTLLFETMPAEEALPGPAALTMIRGTDAIDLPRLAADIRQAGADVAGWYDRLVARPAAQAAAGSAPSNNHGREGSR